MIDGMTRLRRGAIMAIVIFAAFFANPLVALHARDGVLTPAATARAGRVQPFDRLFDAVTKTTSENFYSQDILRSTDWLARAKSQRERIANAPDQAAAVQGLNALLGELKTSHTALFTPDDHQYYTLLDIVGLRQDETEFTERLFWGDNVHYPGIGIFTGLVGGRHFIDGVMEGSPAARAGLLFGDEIVSVDGKPYRPIASFRGRIGGTARIEVRRSEGAPPLTFDVLVVPVRPKATFAAATAASVKIIEKDGKLIGYVHAWSVHSAEGLAAALMQLPGLVAEKTGKKRHEVDALIVDMRGRVGGQVDVAAAYLDFFNAPAKPYWGTTKFQWRNRPKGHNDEPQPGNPAFRGRTVMLIDPSTRSAGEMVALGFKKTGFGKVVGTRTAGAVSSGRIFLMPGELMLYVAVTGLTFDGVPIEGRGVAPDIIAERPLPYAAGADPVLERGLSVASELAAASPLATQ